MERRLLTFIVASTAFFLVYLSLQVMFGVPPKPVPKADPQDQLAELETDPADLTVKPEGVASADSAGLGDSAEAGDVGAGLAVDDAEPRPETGRCVTLGSMDPNDGYYMLVTLNSRGAGVERVELTERDERGQLRYRRVDVLSGYLGYFSGQSAPTADGVVVNVVGPGTPAAEAVADGVAPGLQVGDVIVAVRGRPVARPEDITEVLAETKPGQSIQVEVVRPTPGDDNPLGSQPIVFTATLSEHPLDLVRLARDGGADQVVGNETRQSCLMMLGRINKKGIAETERSIAGLPDPTELVWNVEQPDEDSTDVAEFNVQFSDAEMDAVGGHAVGLKRAYALDPESYLLDMKVQIDNLSDQPQDLAYRLEGVNGLTLEGWWYSNKISPNWGGAAARDVIYNTVESDHRLISGYALLKQAKKRPSEADQTIFAPSGELDSRALRYIGVDAQYFTAAYLPSATADADVMTTFRRAAACLVADAAEIPANQERAVNSSFFLDSVVATVPPGQSLQQELRLFAGPKAPELLDDYGLGQAVYYGWFSLPAKILANLLHTLYGLVGNYGIAIVLLTVLVRGAMFPLSRKAAINAQKMQELAPEFKKIAEQYKDDMEGRLKAQRELQQRVGFNPLAGCLPMFLQLPIFIGLYRALSVDIELRQAAISSHLSWASNLAGPDMLAYWGDWLWEYLSGRGTGWLGPYFNVLPVIVVGLFLAQQKMFMPPATDEQTAMTQKVMTYMTLLMGLFFFRVPAGLCIYFITSSLWGIGERILVKKTMPKRKHFDAAVIDGTATPTAAKRSVGLAERVRQRISPPEPEVERPNKRKRPVVSKKKR